MPRRRRSRRANAFSAADPMGQFWKTALLCAPVLFAPAAHAQSQSDLKICSDRSDPAAGYAACSRLLAGGKLGAQRVTAIKLRAIHSANRQDYKAAIVDFTEVINLEPSANHYH